MSGLKVIKSGLLTLLQDKGRFGFSHLGVSQSGFLDEYAALWANKLLQNPLESSCLEILFGDVEFVSETDTNISITGALCKVFINNVEKKMWQSHFIKKGDRLTIQKAIKGTRIYLGVKNGFDEKKELGSVASSLKEKLDGKNGQKIKNCDLLKLKASPKLPTKKIQEKFIPKYPEALELRVTLSYQYKDFSQKELERFFHSVYTITPAFNAMACKLQGEPILCKKDGIISEGISFGAIQIPKNGQPIILLKERQTIGGYPKLGCVLPIDCFALAQAKIGTKITFSLITIEEAQEKMKAFYSLFSTTIPI